MSFSAADATDTTGATIADPVGGVSTAASINGTQITVNTEVAANSNSTSSTFSATKDPGQTAANFSAMFKLLF